MKIEIIRADYTQPRQADDLVELLNGYATDPMGGGMPLPETVRKNLTREMAKRENLCSVLAYVDGQPAGLANCIESFSTFAARGVLNVHDIFVVSEFRGHGICRMMLEEVVTIARERDCCKLTLEVLEGNQAAQAVYRRFGFDGYELDSELGKAVFWQMKL